MNLKHQNLVFRQKEPADRGQAAHPIRGRGSRREGERMSLTGAYALSTRRQTYRRFMVW